MFTITTRTPRFMKSTVGLSRMNPTESRRVVATLEEARDTIEKTEAYQGNVYDDLPESGGTIGPLPDGTIIEVRPS